MGLFLRHLGHGWAQVLIALAPQDGFKQEAAGAGGVVDAAVGELAVLDQVQQVGLDLLGAEQFGAAVVVARHARDGFGVAFLGALGQAAYGHGVEHALA